MAAAGGGGVGGGTGGGGELGGACGGELGGDLGGALGGAGVGAGVGAGSGGVGGAGGGVGGEGGGFELFRACGVAFGGAGGGAGGGVRGGLHLAAEVGRDALQRLPGGERPRPVEGRRSARRGGPVSPRNRAVVARRPPGAVHPTPTHLARAPVLVGLGVVFGGLSFLATKVAARKAPRHVELGAAHQILATDAVHER